MGTTCRTYISKDDLSLSSAYKALREIEHYFCLGEEKLIRIETKIRDVNTYRKFTQEFGSKPTVMVNFKINSAKAISNIIGDPNLYNKSWFFIHLLNPKISWSHSPSYWIDLDNEKEIFKLRLNLPSASGIDICKKELVKMLLFLNQKEILNVSEQNAIRLTNDLLDPSRDRHNSSESFHEFKYFASGLSSIILYFQKEQFDRFGGYLKMAKYTISVMDEYFSNYKSYIQGTLICNQASEVLNILNQIEFIELELNTSLDLRKQDVNDIESFYENFNGNEFNIRLENFDWLLSDISNGVNLVSIYVEEETIKMEIEIDKRIDIDYIHRIEKISGITFT